MPNLRLLLEGYVEKGIMEFSPTTHDDVEYMVGPALLPVEANGGISMMVVTAISLSIPSLSLGERISGGSFIPTGCPTERQVIDAVKSSLTEVTQQRLDQARQTLAGIAKTETDGTFQPDQGDGHAMTGLVLGRD